MQSFSHYVVTLASISFLFGSLTGFGTVDAHVAAWTVGMWCRWGPNGTGPTNNTHNAAPCSPIYKEYKKDWWFQHDRGCDASPPPPGEFLELPAGGSAKVELATTIDLTQFADNPQNWKYIGGNSMPDTPGICNPSGVNSHCDTHANASGTAMAISYNSQISQVTMENLVVFSVFPNSPWYHWATYDVPKDLPPCPPGGCICVWGWVPDQCGIANVYFQAHRCKVTGSTSNKTLATAKPAVYCKGASAKCTKGAKQMIIFNQLSGNNVIPGNFDAPGQVGIPAYNTIAGFHPGAQNDIFN